VSASFPDLAEGRTAPFDKLRERGKITLTSALASTVNSNAGLVTKKAMRFRGFCASTCRMFVLPTT
jgi:hypothetical protein